VPTERVLDVDGAVALALGVPRISSVVVAFWDGLQQVHTLPQIGDLLRVDDLWQIRLAASKNVFEMANPIVDQQRLCR